MPNNTKKSRTLIIDTDTHLTEPATLWTDRMSSKWGDLVPHVKWVGEEQCWFVNDLQLSPVGMSWFTIDEDGEPLRVSGASPIAGGGSSDKGPPRVYDRIHPASYDAAERLKVMDACGIYAAVIYPNLAFFGIDILRRGGNPEFQLEAVQAYNDFLLDWVSPDPNRFITPACIPYWDVEAAVSEIERCAEAGHRGLVTTGAPHLHDQPFLADRHWDPVWAAAQAARLPISFHAGSGDLSHLINPRREAAESQAVTNARSTVCAFLENGIQLTDLLFSGVLPRFPDLKFVNVESGIGWVPFVLEASDYQFQRAFVKDARPEFKELPSWYYYNQVYSNYWFEQLDDWHLDKVGVKNILFETDFPHNTCIAFDEVAEAVTTGMQNISSSDREDILWRNAAKLYSLDVPEGWVPDSQ